MYIDRALAVNSRVMSNLVGDLGTDRHKIKRLEAKIATLTKDLRAVTSRLNALEKKVYGGKVQSSATGGADKNQEGGDDDCVVS